ncbi:MAG: Maf family protein [Treponemataceae bacterium]|nr:Maf family protein [Treponemataceae bacterium]
MEPIILASTSPRRQEILKNLNIPFKVIPANFEEIKPDDISAEDAPEYFASKKVESVARLFPAEQTIPLILGADTAIVYKGKLYGKPADRNMAEEFLKTFSGKTHSVITALAMFNGQLNYLSTRVSKSTVTFRKMTQEEIDWYLNTGEWHGVAGAYRIQGLAQCFITSIKGSTSGIIGLPISDFYDLISEQGYSLLE